MPKVTLDMSTFKALASDTRLDILRALDGKNMSLNEISRITRLNKATLHEHLAKLNEAGLIKRKEREGHKWVYYRLTWKGEGLLHPENTKIVVMFSTTFISLFIAVILLVNFAQPITVGMATTSGDTTYIYEAKDTGVPLLKKSYNYEYVGSINAINQTVENVTAELQSIVQVKNSAGVVYDIADFKLWTPSNTQIDADQTILNYNYAYSSREDNGSFNDTNEVNDTNNETKDLLGFGGEFFGYYPAVPEMIATVQDITLLYYAIVCITFFGVAFTLSTLKLWKNRKPIL